MIGCVFIHGFTGSPYELEPLANHFAHYDWRIYTPTLAGHGGDTRELAKANWQDWIHSAKEAVEQACQECSQVYLVGFSMGGLISAHLSVQYPVNRLVLLSASVYYPNPRQMAQDITQVLRGGMASPGAKKAWTRYSGKIRSTPPRAVWQFRRLIYKLRPDISRVESPTLIIQGGADDLVHPKSPLYVYNHIASKEKQLHILPRSRHVICHDCEQAELIRLVDKFLR